MFFRIWKEYWWVHMMLIFFAAFLFVQPSWAQGTTSQIQLSVSSVIPNISLASNGSGGLLVSWNWSYLGPSYVPANVVEIRTEISNDGITYFGLQSVPPENFFYNYPSLTSGTYTARVTVLDGNDYNYVVGPVTVTSVNPGTSGRGTTTPFESTQLILNGYAYPGPTTVVIFTYNGGFETSLNPNSSGGFTYQTDTLPVGSGTFSFSARDPGNILSAPVVINYDLPANTPVTINNIYLPPTIQVSSSVVTVGEFMEVKGYGYQSGSVSLLVNGPHSRAYLIQSNSLGFWSTSIDTGDLGPGTYDAVAQSTSQNGGFVSPNSETLLFELVLPVPAPPVCGNGLLETPEQCDDGNTVNGDVCSSTCQLESGLPQSSIDQPDISLFTAEPIMLDYSASSPNGAIDLVEVFYSRNGGPYELYPASFVSGVIQLNGLPDGDYEVYSIARDDTGVIEFPPIVPDATFKVDRIAELNILAYPEKRFPRQGNWAIPARLSVYDVGSTNVRFTYDITTDQQGRYDVNAVDFSDGNYHFLLKGISHLSKRLDNLNYRGVDLMLDYTLGGVFHLLAGDVHVSKDDYVNGLDLSATVLRLYSSFLDADLNGDGYVNGMDLSIVVGNLYERGEG